jgi:hypothetical protein
MLLKIQMAAYREMTLFDIFEHTTLRNVPYYNNTLVYDPRIVSVHPYLAAFYQQEVQAALPIDFCWFVCIISS